MPLTEYGISERGLILEGRVCRYPDANTHADANADADADADVGADVNVDVAKGDVVVEFDSYYLGGYCDV